MIGILLLCLPSISSPFCGTSMKFLPMCSCLDCSTGWPYDQGWPRAFHLFEQEQKESSLTLIWRY